jgi:uncharacterized damage-inducible protein DinB
MDILEHIRLLGRYNQWMNQKIYDAASKLTSGQLAEDRGAFFGSLLNTLNHLVATDVIWGHRLGAHPAARTSLAPILEMERPTALNQVLHHDLPGLWQTRQKLDQVLLDWTAALSESDLDYLLEYRNMKGVPQRKLYGSLVLNLFSHHTHHRGQVTTLLYQFGQDVGVTDLLALIPDAVNA